MLRAMKFNKKPYWLYDYEGHLVERNQKAKEIDEMDELTGQSVLNWKANDRNR